MGRGGMMPVICAVTLVINLSLYPINQQDKENQAVAAKRCVVHYKDSPCLKKFIKVEPLVYRAICGESEKGC